MTDLIRIQALRKTFDGGHEALKGLDLAIRDGEILALLGPNGAGKTTLISIICGLVTPTSGSVHVAGADIITAYRKTRALIGLVPQEITLEPFTTVWKTVRFTRALFGKSTDDAYLEQLLKSLTLWEKKDSLVMALSGGMKRRVLIAKALSHQPRILFLDEPTAGVDVELRKSMWELVEQLRESGVTIILTTHYIEEAEEIADRVAVINKGEILLVEDKDELMRKLGKKELVLELVTPLAAIPPALKSHGLEITDDGCRLIYRYETTGERTGITALLGALGEQGIRFRDINTRESSLEQIFVNLVREGS